jgi:uncharacterized protein
MAEVLQARINEIIVYPVKSCAGISLTESLCGETGLQYDRQWAIVDDSGQVLTQRTVPKLALIEPALDASGRLTLRAPGMTVLAVAPLANTESTAHLWGDACASWDQGEDAARWLSEFSGQSCRLVSGADDFRRLSKYGQGAERTAPIIFADSCPVLVIGQESLADLNKRLTSPVPMNRFRPSIVIEGFGPYGEDSLRELCIGDVKLVPVKACARCVIVTIDQAEPSKRVSESLSVLAEYRRVGDKVMFGQFFATAKPGSLLVGAAIV